LPRAAGTSSAAEDAVDQVVDVDHGTALLALADDRELAVAHHAEERRLPRRLERPVEPRRPHDGGVEAGGDRFVHGHLALHLRGAVAQVRVERFVVAERVVRVGVGAERAVGRHVHEPTHARIAGRIGQVARAVGVDVVELPDTLRVDDAGGVHDVGVRSHAVQQAGSRVRPSTRRR
jgi:hypothetical protein